LPLEFNDGTPIPDLHYLNLQEELLRRFGGVTSVQRQFPLQGIWQNETDVYSDNIVVISPQSSEGFAFVIAWRCR
jgi:hypothetical protein